LRAAAERAIVSHSMSDATVTLILQITTLAGVGAAVYLQRTLKAYASEKGKNLATREDVAEITRQVEAVKADYAKQLLALEHAQKVVLEQANQRHQLSLAAIDRRLQAHQEAFAKSNELAHLAHDRSPDATDKVNSLLQWYRENCL
jgi:hypothetical protein